MNSFLNHALISLNTARTSQNMFLMIIDQGYQMLGEKGVEHGSIAPRRNGQDHSWQKDLGQVYRTCRDFYERPFIAPLQFGK